MGQANMFGYKFGVATQITKIQPKALATHCRAHSLDLTGNVLAWMHSNYADDVDATTLKTEFLAFKKIFKEKANHFDDILRALEETTLDTRLLFPNINSTATHKSPQKDRFLAVRFHCCS